MATPVKRETAIGELRQSILAVLVGNPLFTEEEQLLANHTTYECDDELRLATWLRNVRRKDAERNELRRVLHALSIATPGICDDKQRYQAEVAGLRCCALLHRDDRQIFELLSPSSYLRVGDRIGHLGLGYQLMFERLGVLPDAKRGYAAIMKN